MQSFLCDQQGDKSVEAVSEGQNDDAEDNVASGERTSGDDPGKQVTKNLNKGQQIVLHDEVTPRREDEASRGDLTGFPKRCVTLAAFVRSFWNDGEAVAAGIFT